jgi:hypothetical protein
MPNAQWGLPKWGRTEAVFHPPRRIFNLASYPLSFGANCITKKILLQQGKNLKCLKNE